MSNQGRILTCVYCGHEYPQDTPAWGDTVLTEHIKICEKHPMRKAEADILKLRKSLVAIIGTEDEGELENMELAIRASDAPEVDKINTINAIMAILSTAKDK